MSPPKFLLRFAAFAALFSVPVTTPAWAQPSALDAYAGYYRNGQADFRVSQDNSLLYVQGPGEPNIELRPSGPDRFVGPHWAYQFVRNRQDQITGLRAENRTGQVTLWPRLSDAQARAVAARQAAYLARREPQPGVEVLLRRHILAFEQGMPIYAELGTNLTRGMRGGLPIFQKMLGELGRFQSLTYKQTLASGADVFSARHEKGSLEWVINPPGADGKIQNLAFRPEDKP